MGEMFRGNVTIPKQQLQKWVQIKRLS